MSRQIVVDIVGDASKFTRATKEATGSASKFGNLFGKGLGIGAGIGTFNLASMAVDKLTNVLGDAVSAALEDQASIARLNTSLKANVKGWDGRTDAIEKTLAAQMDLGFSDDEQRDSMAQLVVATGSVEESLSIMRTAMDLARLKGIDLKTATQALIKVEAGQYRGLKALGIELKTGATRTEALAAVQKVANGQAADYAETTEGKLLVAQTKFGEATERLGYAVLPALSDALTIAVDGLDAFTALLDSDSPETFIESLQGIGDTLNTINPLMWASNVVAGQWADAQEEAAADASEAMAVADGAFQSSSREMGRSLNNVADAAKDTARTVKRSSKNMVTDYSEVAAYLLGKFNDDFDTAMGIIEAREALRNAKSDEERAEAYANLAEYGALSETDYDKWIDVMERMAKGTKGKVHDAYEAAIADIRALRAAAARTVVVRVEYKGASTVGKNDERHAAGGTTMAGRVWVGEEGPEAVDLPPGSFVHRASDSRRIGGGGSVTINVSTPLLTPGSAEALAAAIGPALTRYQQQRGV